MKWNASFVRKIVYIAAMALLLLPLSFLSRPSTRAQDGTLNQGGQLARMRDDYGLSQADLGEIDPASESMKLATLGMRGVAANILWTKANHYKKTEDWDNLRATLDQITKLQPNFVSVWIFQGWNMSYNVSVEFDDFRSRYHWVKKGIDFLIEGTTYNRNEPRLLKELGWFFGHKIGRSDETVQFRNLFRADEDFHRVLVPYLNLDDALGPDNSRPDNWKVARQWYRQAQNAVDRREGVMSGESPLIFNSHAPMALIRYAEAIEKEGYLDEKAQVAWEQATQDWYAFGDRDIPHSFGFEIRLNQGEQALERVQELQAELEALLPGVREEIRQEKYEALPEDQQRAMEKYEADSRSLTDEQYMAYDAAKAATEVSHVEVVERAPADKLGDARRLLAQLQEAEMIETGIRRYRTTVNFDYWKRRCEAEKTTNAINARRYLYESEKLRADADLERAREGYEKSWDYWAQVFDEFPLLMDDITAKDLMDSVTRYKEVLDQLDEPFPPPGFKLLELVQLHNDEFELLTGGARESDDAVDLIDSLPSDASGEAGER